jgi:hypothetical protein
MPVPIPRDDSHPVPLSRQGHKQLDRIREQAVINEEAATVHRRALERDVAAERQLSYGRGLSRIGWVTVKRGLCCDYHTFE